MKHKRIDWKTFIMKIPSLFVKVIISILIPFKRILLKGELIKDKIIVWKAFWMKVPSLLVETVLFIFVSFAGIILNVIFLFGIQPTYALNLTGMQMLKTNEFLYGCFSTITCIALSMLYFYMTNNNTRIFMKTILIIIILLTVMFSTVSLTQSNPMINDFFSADFMFNGLICILIILNVSVFIYKFDIEQAVSEYKSRKMAREYTGNGIVEENINGKKVRA